MSEDDERQVGQGFDKVKAGLTEDIVHLIAEQLTDRADRDASGVPGLRERKDLEPVAVAALVARFGDLVAKERKVPIPHWPDVGNVDLLLRRPGVEGEPAWICELKWCGPGRDVLYEGIWDLFKMALGSTGENRSAAFMIAGAENAIWEGSSFADLFETKTHTSDELCGRRLPDRRETLAWDDLLRGGYDRYPDCVPVEIITETVGRASVGDWELRAVRVSPISDEVIMMTGGWPRGVRPTDARHPVKAVPDPPPAAGVDDEPTGGADVAEVDSPEPSAGAELDTPAPQSPATASARSHKLFRRRSEEEKRAELVYQALLRDIIDGSAELRGLADRLHAAAGETGLKARKLTHLNVSAFRALAERVLEDDLLTEGEEGELGLVGEALGVLTGGSALPGDLASRLMIARINDGRMPVEEQPKLMAKSGETVYAELEAELMKEVVHREYRGGSSGVSFKVAPGVRYRTSGLRGKSVVVGTSLEQADKGVLSLTSTRVVFQGSRKTIESRLDRLTSVDVLNDGIRISVSNRQTPSLYRVGVGAFAGAVVLAAAQRTAQG